MEGFGFMFGDGNFIVKFVYWLGVIGKEKEDEGFVVGVIEDCWVLIWVFEMLLKIKYFLWGIFEGFYYCFICDSIYVSVV